MPYTITQTRSYLTVGTHADALLDPDIDEVNIGADGYGLRWGTISVAPSPADRGDRQVEFDLIVEADDAAALWDMYNAIVRVLGKAEAAEGPFGRTATVTWALALQGNDTLTYFPVTYGTISAPAAGIYRDMLVAHVSLTVLAYGHSDPIVFPESSTIVNSDGAYFRADVPGTAPALAILTLSDKSTSGAISRFRGGVMARDGLEPGDFVPTIAQTDSRHLGTAWQEVIRFVQPAAASDMAGLFDAWIVVEDATAAVGNSGGGTDDDGNPTDAEPLVFTVEAVTPVPILIEQSNWAGPDATMRLTRQVALAQPPEIGNTIIMIAGYQVDSDATSGQGQVQAPAGFDQIDQAFFAVIREWTQPAPHIGDDPTDRQVTYSANIQSFSRAVTSDETGEYSWTVNIEIPYAFIWVAEISGVDPSGNIRHASGTTAEPSIASITQTPTIPSITIVGFSALWRAATAYEHPTRTVDGAAFIGSIPSYNFNHGDPVIGPASWTKHVDNGGVAILSRVENDAIIYPGVNGEIGPPFADNGDPYAGAVMLTVPAGTFDEEGSILIPGTYEFYLSELDYQGNIARLSTLQSVALTRTNSPIHLYWELPHTNRSSARGYTITWRRTDSDNDIGWLAISLTAARSAAQRYTLTGDIGDEATDPTGETDADTGEVTAPPLVVTAEAVTSSVRGVAYVAGGNIGRAGATVFPRFGQRKRHAMYAGMHALPPAPRRADGGTEDWEFAVEARHGSQSPLFSVYHLALFPHDQGQWAAEYPGLSNTTKYDWTIRTRPDERAIVTLHDQGSGDVVELGTPIRAPIIGPGDCQIIIQADKTGGLYDLSTSRFTAQLTILPRWELQAGTLIV